MHGLCKYLRITNSIKYSNGPVYASRNYFVICLTFWKYGSINKLFGNWTRDFFYLNTRSTHRRCNDSNCTWCQSSLSSTYLRIDSSNWRLLRSISRGMNLQDANHTLHRAVLSSILTRREISDWLRKHGLLGPWKNDWYHAASREAMYETRN